MIGLGRIRWRGKPAAYGGVEFRTVAERNIRDNDPDAKNRSENCRRQEFVQAKKEPDIDCNILLQSIPGQKYPIGRQKNGLEAR